MAATNYTPISLYYSTTASAVPTAGNLVNGELAINITDGKLYYKNNSGVVTLIAGATSGPAGGSNTQVQYNSSGVLAGSANLTFNGTTLTANTIGAFILSGNITQTGNPSINIGTGALTAGATAVTTLSASGALTYGGVTLSNSVTGTGSMVLATSPTLTTPNIGAATGSSLNIGSGALTAGAITGSGTALLGGSGGDAFFINAKVGVDAYLTLNTGATATGQFYFGSGGANIPINFRVNNITPAIINASGMNGVLGATTPAAASVTTLTASSYAGIGGATGSSTYLLRVKLATDKHFAVSSNIDNSDGIAIASFDDIVSVNKQFEIRGSNVRSVISGITRSLLDSTGLAVTGALSATGTLSGGTSGTGYSFSGSAAAGSLTLDASGNLLVGTASALAKLTVEHAIALSGAGASKPGGLSYGLYLLNGVGTVLHSAASIAFAAGDTERARIDSSGNLLVGATSGSGERFHVTATANNQAVQIINSNATANGTIGGIYVNYTGAAPNSTGFEFLRGDDTGGNRFAMRSNGGLANYSGNDANLSDRREKMNFAPAKSYLETLCAIPVQTFNYIDQNLEDDPGLTLGVVAQDVQEVAPELVMESNWGTAENPKMRLSIYQTDLQYAMLKAIQEQQAMIQSLRSRVALLEAK